MERERGRSSTWQAAWSHCAHEETPYRQIQREGKWTVEELVTLVPNSLMAGIQNPAPPPAGLEIPGRAAPQAAG